MYWSLPLFIEDIILYLSEVLPVTVSFQDVYRFSTHISALSAPCCKEPPTVLTQFDIPTYSMSISAFGLFDVSGNIKSRLSAILLVSSVTRPISTYLYFIASGASFCTSITLNLFSKGICNSFVPTCFLRIIYS